MAIVDELMKELGKNDSILNILWNKQEYCNTTYSAELIAASSNNGTALLDSASVGNAIAELDALAVIDVKGVSISINYPFLADSFHNSAEYLSYYRKIVEEVRNRGLKLFISSMEAVKDTIINKLEIEDYYINLTTERFKKEKALMLQKIIDELQPDYLTIENEPSTVLKITGLKSTVDSVSSYIDYFLSHIDKKQTRIGAGSGTWEDIRYWENMAKKSSIDYLDIHYFPIFYNTYLLNAIKMDSIAREYNKPVVFGKAWQYKANTAEILYDTLTSVDNILSRDAFDTFIPVDSMFVSVLFNISNMFESEYTSFYNSQYFFGYIHYIKLVYEHMPAYQILSIAKDSITEKIAHKTLSKTGLVYKNLIYNLCNPLSVKDNSIQNNIQKAQITFYPNPVRNNLNIEVYLPEESNVGLKLFNIEGKECICLLNKRLYKGINKFNFDTANIPKGLYFLKLQKSDTIISKKIVLM